MQKVLQCLRASLDKYTSSIKFMYQIVLLRTFPPSLGRDTLALGTPGTLWGWALRGHSGVGHETLRLGTQGDSGAGQSGWARQADSVAGHSTLGWALQGHSGVRHSMETLGLGTPETLKSWALQGQFGVGHSKDERGVDRARRRVPGEEKNSGRGEELSLKCNNPTPQVGNKRQTAANERSTTSMKVCKPKLADISASQHKRNLDRQCIKRLSRHLTGVAAGGAGSGMTKQGSLGISIQP